jgi:hypothetical protein
VLPSTELLQDDHALHPPLDPGRRLPVDETRVARSHPAAIPGLRLDDDDVQEVSAAIRALRTVTTRGRHRVEHDAEVLRPEASNCGRWLLRYITIRLRK